MLLRYNKDNLFWHLGTRKSSWTKFPWKATNFGRTSGHWWARSSYWKSPRTICSDGRWWPCDNQTILKFHQICITPTFERRAIPQGSTDILYYPLPPFNWVDRYSIPYAFTSYPPPWSRKTIHKIPIICTEMLYTTMRRCLDLTGWASKYSVKIEIELTHIES